MTAVDLRRDREAVAPRPDPIEPEPTDAGELQEVAGWLPRLAEGLPATVRRISLRCGSCAIELELHPPQPVAGPVAGSGPAASRPLPEDAAPEPASPGSPGDLAAAPADDAMIVRAPLVGTFYAAPSPGAEPFVRPGDVVEAGAQLAILEAMKLMNAVTAPAAGVVTRVLAEDGLVVEYDQAMFTIAPRTATT